MVEFVFRDHLRLAGHAALLFAAGLFAAWPIVHYRLRGPARLPLAIFRLVLGLMGRSPSIARMAAVIFCFNTSAIFLYMSTGFHPLLPKVLCVWTGLNVGLIAGAARLGESRGPGRPGADQWTPPRGLTLLCGLLVLLLELPAFWFSIAMGISMGHAVQSGGSPYLGALAVRAGAYFALVAPALLVSALAEAVAVRGSAGRAPLP